ncbi:hypothetical protein PROFUN_06481, partial [Planoprotostelium fungivorum]
MTPSVANFCGKKVNRTKNKAVPLETRWNKEVIISSANKRKDARNKTALRTTTTTWTEEQDGPVSVGPHQMMSLKLQQLMNKSKTAYSESGQT